MKILIAGDFVPQNRVEEMINSGDYSCIEGVKNIVANVSYSIINLECPVLLHNTGPIKKRGPNLHCTEKAIECISKNGFKCVTLANNHYMDYGRIGVEDTLNTCRKYNIDFIGGGIDEKEAGKTFFKEVQGKTLSVINCCEHEFSIATENTAGSNPLDPIQQYYAIREARKNADYVIVIVHGGHEHFQLPSPRMVKTYRFFIDAGADAVINHHQHCYSGFEIYKEKPIFYGIGNFCFDKAGARVGKWNEGYMVTLDFNNDCVEYAIHPYRQCGKKPCVELLPADSFGVELNRLNTIIADPIKLKEEVEVYYEQSGGDYVNVLEPIDNKFYYAAKRRGLMPSLVSLRRLLMACNYVCCESHRDKLTYIINGIIKKRCKK